MADTKISTKASFSTVDDVQNKWNLKERSLEGGKLKSFEAIGDPEKHVTVGSFEEIPGAPFGLGNLIMKEDAKSSNTAWINGKKINISFSSSSGK